METYRKTDDLFETPVFRHFYNLNQIPRGTFNEKEASDFLRDFGLSLGLDVIQDEMKNVIVRKPASAGCEGAPTVMLQAHMDMVCEKMPDIDHDFTKDPIDMCVEGDFITTGGKTTLGADNGIGVAYIMAILEDDKLCHPPLEAIFTTREEEDFGGALGVNLSDLKGEYLINLDHGVENQILCGSCGGTGAELTLSNIYGESENEYYKLGYESYEVAISGLAGGHSGEDIHRGIGNANILLGRLLHAVESKCDCYLAYINGGSTRSALPRDGAMVLMIKSNEKEIFVDIIEKMEKQFKQEHGIMSPELCLKITRTEFHGRVLEKSSMERLVTALYLSPNGILEMNGGAGNVVESSSNLGIIVMDEEKIKIVYEIRATYKSTQKYIVEKIEKIAKICGGEVNTFCDYPSWAYRHNCKLKKMASEVYAREFGREAELVVVHAGIECGCFFKEGRELSAISIGPDCFGFHSPKECANISSVKRVYEFLKAILMEISKS